MGDKKRHPTTITTLYIRLPYTHKHLGDNIKMDLRQTEGERVIRIQILQNRSQWETSGQTDKVINLWIS